MCKNVLFVFPVKDMTQLYWIYHSGINLHEPNLGNEREKHVVFFQYFASNYLITSINL